MRNVYYILYKIKNNKHKVARSNFPFKKPNKDNVILVKLLEEGFNRPVYWNEYKTRLESKNLDKDNLTRFPLHASFQGVRRLFFLVFDNTNTGNKKFERNSHTKYFLPRVNITD